MQVTTVYTQQQKLTTSKMCKLDTAMCDSVVVNYYKIEQKRNIYYLFFYLFTHTQHGYMYYVVW